MMKNTQTISNSQAKKFLIYLILLVVCNNVYSQNDTTTKVVQSIYLNAPPITKEDLINLKQKDTLSFHGKKGYSIEIYQNGHVKEEGYRKKSSICFFCLRAYIKKVGIWKYYTETGQLWKIEEYTNKGDLIEIKVFYVTPAY